MAQVKIAGNSVVIESAAKLEELKLVAKYRPEALTLRDEEGEAVFAIGVATSPCGDISKYGAAFAPSLTGENAIITLCMMMDEHADLMEWLADEIGPAVEHINEIESKLPDVILEIMDKREAFKSSVQVL